MSSLAKTLASKAKRLISDGTVFGPSNMPESEMITIINQAYLIVSEEPALIELKTPVKMMGDIHGQLSDLLRAFDTCGWPCTNTPYIMLGDYVDRGQQGIECIILLLALKVLKPTQIYLLRGNHECAGQTRIYGFLQECLRRYNSAKLWKCFVAFFDYLPIMARIDERIAAVHGGLSPQLHSLEQVRQLKRPLYDPALETSFVNDLLWSDPDNEITTASWIPNELRGTSFLFGRQAFVKSCQQLGIDMLVRAHAQVEDGYEFTLGEPVKGAPVCVTLFSASNYCNVDRNAGAVMSLEIDWHYRFDVFRPQFNDDVKPLKKQLIARREKKYLTHRPPLNTTCV